jgi:hypothetical protein
MPCYSQDNVPEGYIAKFPDGPTYESEEDCLDACAEGACCETDGTCNIKPQCECDTDNGAVFAGVGEKCEASTCNWCKQPYSCEDVTFDIEFSDFLLHRRLGVRALPIGAGRALTRVEECDIAYGFDSENCFNNGRDNPQCSDILLWEQWFDSIRGTVFFSRGKSTLDRLVWYGESSTTNPLGATVTHSFEVVYTCGIRQVLISVRGVCSSAGPVAFIVASGSTSFLAGGTSPCDPDLALDPITQTFISYAILSCRLGPLDVNGCVTCDESFIFPCIEQDAYRGQFIGEAKLIANILP